MTTQELRELDAWIAEHVMGWKRVDSVLHIFGKDQFATSSYFKEPPRVIIYEGYNRIQSWIPTERQGDAMDVLKKCAERICDKWDETNCIQIQFWDLEWHIADSSEDSDLPPAKAETLELAICLFAKQLFSKTTAV